MSMIAKRSGVSAGIIYHYFENKDALIHALYKEVKASFSAVILAGAPETLPWPENLKRVWLNAFHYYAAHPQETLFLEQYENSPYQGDFAAHFLMDDNLQTLGEMVQNGIAAGDIRPMPIDVLYELTLGVAIGLAKRQINGAITLDALTLDTVANAICRAIAP